MSQHVDYLTNGVVSAKGMTVWVLEGADGECGHVLGLFATQEAAVSEIPVCYLRQPSQPWEEATLRFMRKGDPESVAGRLGEGALSEDDYFALPDHWKNNQHASVRPETIK